MKKFFTAILTLFVTVMSLPAQETLFPYPSVPADIENFTDRANFAVTHFWDQFPFNRPVTDQEKLGQAFYDYLMLISLADAETVHASIDNLILQLNKDPEKLLSFALFAQDMCYDPSGDFVSDELYLPFARAVVNHKKIKSYNKALFEPHIKVLETTALGKKAPNFTFEKPDGSKASLDDFYGKYIILFFNDPGCGDCNLARVRLSADININKHIEDGELIVISIYPYPADEDWRAATSRYNPTWIVGAFADADEVYDMRHTPSIYYLNPRHNILSKDVSVDELLQGFRKINTKNAN